ncbi:MULTISPECIES: 2-C-methyl-D-erythritol 2,4-cyclodiphosphate synthase [unclassified Oceanispirochaeta]|uniref:2-C-methyl-D-erythritol 2,4-cyclodiphosphate synthase n=1 Tax=unclassified Oceanispirochaeta TaxID=2635722 RepID=UPI000E09D9ED|nr:MULTISPECIES: 2-C-methyl-D-erythritol 2,4-cyclodiphosphate synthase [unclassified Oceanispirochaeta]MBF9015415.1 2-C-methyl-D-erythritol 2,4-cyclodiphosphate synthase [Oceanispirochaeta sp. M2]NPD71874.1 2-C-methyl-D-erythritol 2,4-cyclodiphosphate synthase [Oceanispirochaeta sp. M1]RDG32683.1 2-C-methyl-D-erythritol 2,4-cyclodiphosphate synthase [Oceanispirochaeta sp. M1]
MRIGQGYDIHRLVENRPLILGGVTIPSEKGEDAHSDGDVLLHALIDALLGAIAQGDIGTHYPPSDPAWKNVDSRRLLRETLAKVENASYSIANIDCTVILEKPKLGPHREQIRLCLQEDLKIPLDCISFKAKTKEKMDAAGRGEAVEALATVLLTPKN